LQSAEHLGCGDGTLPENARLEAGQVHDSRRRAWHLAAVESGCGAGANLLRHVLEAAGIGAAGEVGARRDDGADARDDLSRGARQIRDADAERVGIRAREPVEPVRRVRDDERQRSRQQVPDT
jgi:hypothetical protein